LRPCYYARQDVKTPVKIGIIAMVSNMVFNLMLVWHFKHVGLAFASTLSAFLNAGLLYWGLHKQGVYRLQKHWLALGMRYGVANVAMVGVLCGDDTTRQAIIGLCTWLQAIN
jgi:putative peptidoglycan lipid II flippase